MTMQTNTQAAQGWISVKDQMPATGIRVLFGWTNSNGLWRTSVGQWNARFTNEATDCDVEACEYNEADDTYYALEGWQEWGWELDFSAYITQPVTHWMRLPAKPDPFAGIDMGGVDMMPLEGDVS